jgi:predicted RNA-binding Zn ribbon-like protein
VRRAVTSRGVRFGGHATPDGWRFELSGGHPALDFVNTLDERPAPEPRERLPDYAALLGWCAQTGVLQAVKLRKLRAEAARRPAAATAAVRRARALRETLFALFSALAAGESLPRGPLAAFNRDLGVTMARLRVASAAGAPRWELDLPPEALDAMLPPLVRAAADLLTSPDRARVHRCEGDGCAWLFLDSSRNHSRRWCDMTVCGNRAKARRHRARARR